MAGRMLRSHWRTQARIEDVAEILGDVERLPEWWGAVYLEAELLAPGAKDGLGRRVRFLSRGWLPYRLNWIATVTEADRPHGWHISAAGDLQGEGVWRLVQDGSVADIRYDWFVNVAKPWQRHLAPLLWPVFAANHRWAMARGEEGLRAELARRRLSPA